MKWEHLEINDKIRECSDKFVKFPIAKQMDEINNKFHGKAYKAIGLRS